MFLDREPKKIREIDIWNSKWEGESNITKVRIRRIEEIIQTTDWFSVSWIGKLKLIIIKNRRDYSACWKTGILGSFWIVGKSNQ